MWNLVSFAQNHNRGFSEAAGIESGCNAGDTGDENSTPGLGRSPVGGNDNPLQYSCLDNTTDRGPWRATVYEVTKSRT